MEKAYRNMMLAAALEVLMLPVFYWVYDAYGFLFWCLLYAMDAFLYKRMELLALLKSRKMKIIVKKCIGFSLLKVCFYLVC